MDRREIDFKFLYPNLIIFLSSTKKMSLFKKIDKSFKEFQYGPLFKQKGTCYKHDLGHEVSTCRIMQGAGIPVCLAEGEGTLPCDAEQQAVKRLLDKLCDSCYVVKANEQYFTRKSIPTFALDADPSQSHVYKVVYLRTNSSGFHFPKPVFGAIDYVETYDELMAYIKTHAKSDTKADLFILNVWKYDRARIRRVCQTIGMSTKFMANCLAMGVYAFHELSTLQILQSLLKYGGKNAKYKLIGPRDKYGDNEDKVAEKVDAGGVKSEYSTEEDEEIVINQWIADHLVIMEIVTDRSELRPKHQIIGQSVKDCPDTQQFIIEKKRTNTGMILAEALIDRNVVGRARGYIVRDVKVEAGEKAMNNLRKCCYYIQAKQSYFGSSEDVPYFLQHPRPVPETKIYRIADKRNGWPKKILLQFKSARQEDLYFLNDFTEEEKLNIEILAINMDFMVRWLGRMSYLCVFKRIKPNEVLMELLSTSSQENEKYKLITPPSKIHEQVDGRATRQNWNNQGISHDAQANIQPINRGQESYNTASVSLTKVNTSDYQSPHVDHGSASQSFKQFQPINRGQESYNPALVSHTKVNTSDYQSPYVDHGRDSQSFKQFQPINRGQESYNTPSVSHTKVNTSDYQSPYVDHGRDSQSFKQFQPINRGQESYNTPSVSHTKVNTSDYQSPYVDHGSDSQSFNQFQPTNSGQESYNHPSMSVTKVNTTAYKSPYINHGIGSQSFEYGTEATVGENKETPNWVMKFIQTAPLKPGKPSRFKISRPIEPPVHREDVYNRYKCIAPKTLPPPVTASNVNFREADQRPEQNAERVNVTPSKPKSLPPPVTSNVNFQGADERPDQNADKVNVTPSKHIEQGSTLSERFQQFLKEQNRSKRQDVTIQVPSTTSNKRPYDQGPDVKEECEPAEKISRPTTDTYSSPYNSSFASTKAKGEPSNNFSKGQTSELSVQKPTTWDSSVGNSDLEDWSRTGISYDRPSTNNPSFKDENGSKRNMYTMSDTQLNSLRCGENPYDKGSSVNVKNESEKDTSKSFDMRQNSTQQNHSHWGQGTKQQFDQRPNTSTGGQRNFSSLFDNTGPQSDAFQGVSRPIFPPRPPHPLRKNRQFKGHKFSKLKKYGKKKRPY